MPSVAYVDNRRAIRYDGTNSAEIDATIPSFTIVSEIGGVLTFTSTGGWVANTGQWILYTQGVVNNVFDDVDFHTFYIENALFADLDALTTGVADLETALAALGGAALRSAGVASAPTLLLNTPANVAVQLVPAMPDSSYTPSAYLFGTGINLGQVTINSVTVTDADTVTVQVQTSLLSLPGVHVLVVAKD